ncbi:family 20 glycosylhydrolase [Botrimarina mediterranea]|uniref:family 20 glycosylhydrolase n=1 Tax=Botrimarina mediterranea TaxID=2528022 RepID=UPI0018D310ED|nr:family 20 glycosylhydrolase [Botrimarina mediterranea]
MDPSVFDPEGKSTLYFNFVRKPSAVYNSTTGSAVEPINGDLFRVELGRGENKNGPLRIETVFEGAVRHVTDAPAGFFVVTRGCFTESVEPIAVKIDLSVLRRETKPPAAPQRESGAAARRRESVASAAPAAPWIPQPWRYEPLAGVVELSGLPIECSSDHAAAARLLGDAIVAAGGEPPAVHTAIDPHRPAIRLRLGDAPVDAPAGGKAEEAYSLEAREESGVVITGAGPAGLHYGVQTLVAAIANTPVAIGGSVRPAVREMLVRDAPHFRYRGLHLDVARNFQSVATIRKVLDLMAAYKLNRFHFHLTDDEGWRLAIEGLPELTEVGGRRGYSPGFQEFLPPSFGSGPRPDVAPGSGWYSREDFIALLRYANERHIEIIPEIDLPGHSRAAIRAMQVRSERLRAAGDEAAALQFVLRRDSDGAEYESVQMWKDNVIDVRLESSVAFVERVVGDVASMYDEAGVAFRSIHLGGDEVPHGCWTDSNAPETLQQAALFASFMDRCAEIAASHGARSAGWEEVFLAEEGRAALRSGASAGGVCYAWNNIWGWGQEDAAYRLANAGVDVVLCNATHLYFDLAYEDTVDEPGYYWAGATDVEEVFRFQPYAYFDAPLRDRFGNPIPVSDREPMTRLSAKGQRHIIGMQGHLWGENLNSAERLEYMMFPRLLALAEIAWAGPADSRDADADPSRTWVEFEHHLAERELPRLRGFLGGVKYRPLANPTIAK